MNTFSRLAKSLVLATCALAPWSSASAQSAVHFGTGCGSPALSLQNLAVGPLVINRAVAFRIRHHQGNPHSIMFGNAVASPPDLAPFGAPGCLLLQDTQFVLNGIATFADPISTSWVVPNIRGLVGVPITLQSVAIRPGANALGIVVSNAVTVTLGS